MATTYITRADFEKAFGADELGDLLETGEDFATTENASASLIDGYIGARYALPLAATPAVVKGWALDVTRYRLWDDAAPDEVRRRYEDAVSQLKDLAAGRLTLPPDATGVAAGAGFDYDAEFQARVFTSDTLEDF